MTIDKNLVTHIAFDFDGTLIDSMGISEKMVQRVISIVGGQNISDEEAAATNHIADVETWKKYGIYHKLDEIEQAEKELIPEFAMQQKFYDGTHDLLESLKQQGYALSAITNRSDHQVTNDPVLSQILSYFDIIITCDTSGAAKPDVAPMNHFLNHYGIRPENAIYVGDSLLDYQASKSANIPFVLAEFYDSGTEIPAKYKITELDQLQDLLK